MSGLLLRSTNAQLYSANGIGRRFQANTQSFYPNHPTELSSFPLPISVADLASTDEEDFRYREMNRPLMKQLILMSLATLTLLSQSCSKDDSGKELRQANDDLRRENSDLRQGNEALQTKVAALEQQLAQSMARIDEMQRANQAVSQKAVGEQVVAQEEAKKRLEADTRLRIDQNKQHIVATVGKITAQLDRLMEEVPSLENSSLIAWDASMPKLATCSKDASLQLNSLVAELDGLKFERCEDIRSKIAGFTNGYKSLPGIGRLVVSSRERAAALRAAADPAKSDADLGAGEEITMNTQLSVFNATLAECKRLQAEVSKLAN